MDWPYDIVFLICSLNVLYPSASQLFLPAALPAMTFSSTCRTPCSSKNFISMVSSVFIRPFFRCSGTTYPPATYPVFIVERLPAGSF